MYVVNVQVIYTGLHAVKLLLLVVVHCIFPFKGLLENAPLYNPDFHDGI